MNHTEVLAALLILERRVPDRHVTVDESMAIAWHSDLAPFPALVAMRAAESWQQIGFPSAAEFLMACQAEARALRQAEEAAYMRGEEGTTSCPVPCDNGMVDTTDAGPQAVYPCPWCRPAQHAIWQHRNAPDHEEDHCADCIGIKKQKVPAWAATASPQRPVEQF